MRASLSLLALGAALSVSAPAQASTVFAEHISQKLGTPCVPQCTICHTTNLGGGGTVTRAFGINAKTFMLLPQSLVQLDNVLTQLALPLTMMDGVDRDVDDDAISDIDELKQGTDPNPGNEPLCVTVPAYGCGATIAKTPKRAATDGTATAAALLTALVGLLALRRRR